MRGVGRRCVFEGLERSGLKVPYKKLRNISPEALVSGTESKRISRPYLRPAREHKDSSHGTGVEIHHLGAAKICVSQLSVPSELSWNYPQQKMMTQAGSYISANENSP
eukprot:gene27033-biopygen6304